MTYQNRSRRLLLDFTLIGLVGGGVIAVVSAIVLNSNDAKVSQLAAAAVWLSIGQALFSFGALALIGLTVAKSVAYDIRNPNLPEVEDKPAAPVAEPDSEPTA